MQALENNKHVLIEKPLSINYSKSKTLVEKAKSKNLVLMTDLTYLYNGAVQKIDSLISSGELGTIQYIDSTRINLGIFQNDINVLGDLAAHDLSIIYYLIQEKPISVSAIGKCHYNPYIENLGYLNLFYNSDLIVHIHCSWSAPVKVRQMIIGGDKKMLIYNDVEPTEKIKVYDAGYQLYEKDKDKILVDYRIGDVHIPKYDTREALNYMIEDFAEAIITGAKPLANTDISLQIMRTIHAANISMKENGKMIEL
jgi:predicted dehydrogenase